MAERLLEVEDLSVHFATVDGTVKAVDGGTDAPANYWLVTGRLSAFVPKFPAQ